MAPDLLGRVLVRQAASGPRLAARIVEVEAYAPDDPASHSFRGRTQRNAVMFGPPGHLYVYFTYGMHFCMNVVTGGGGDGSAVLLRAAEPLDGIDQMRRRRRRSTLRDLCSGPAKLCQAFGVDRRMNGWDLVRGSEMWLLAGEPVDRVRTGPRVGIHVGTERPWRFRADGDPFVSGAGASTRRASSGPPRR